MGKTSSKKLTKLSKGSINQDDERRKVQSSVLEILKQRVDISPSGGLIVGDVTPYMIAETDEEQSQKNNNKVEHAVETSEDEDDDEDEILRREKSSHKIRKRKTRAERNRLRTKKLDSNENNNTKEMRQHIQKAHDITSTSRIDRNIKERVICTITQNRLTRKLGLFNQGKKSETIRVPESVKAHTEADLKKILKPDDSEICYCDIEESAQRVSDEDGSKSSRGSSDNPRITHCTPASGKSLSLPGSESSMDAKLHEISERKYKCVKKSPEFSSSPDLPALADKLISDLGKRMLFPGRGLCKERKEMLCNILKQSSSSHISKTKTQSSANQVSGDVFYRPPSRENMGVTSSATGTQVHGYLSRSFVPTNIQSSLNINHDAHSTIKITPKEGPVFYIANKPGHLVPKETYRHGDAYAETMDWSHQNYYNSSHRARPRPGSAAHFMVPVHFKPTKMTDTSFDVAPHVKTQQRMCQERANSVQPSGDYYQSHLVTQTNISQNHPAEFTRVWSVPARQSKVPHVMSSSFSSRPFTTASHPYQVLTETLPRSTLFEAQTNQAVVTQYVYPASKHSNSPHDLATLNASRQKQKDTHDILDDLDSSPPCEVFPINYNSSSSSDRHHDKPELEVAETLGKWYSMIPPPPVQITPPTKFYPHRLY